MHVRLAILSIIFFLPAIARGKSFAYINYTTNDGLPSNTVYAVRQDKAGNIWMGTENGLCKFDGREFISYGTQHGLNSTTVTAVAISPSGRLAIGNDVEGLNIYEDGNISKVSGWRDGSTIYDLAYLNDTTLVVVEGIARNVNSYVLQPGLEQLRPILPLTVMPLQVLRTNANSPGSEGSLHFTGHSPGCYFFKGNTLYEINLPYTCRPKIVIPPGQAISAMAAGGKSMFIASGNKIYHYRGDTPVKCTSLPPGIESNITRLAVDAFGRIWCYVRGKGVYVVEKGKATNITDNLSLGNVIVNNLFSDRDGNIWMGTTGKGVFYFHSTFITNYHIPDGIVNNNVNSITSARDGDVVLGTWDGVSVIDTGGKVNNYYPQQFIHSVRFDTHGNILVCGAGDAPGKAEGKQPFFYLNAVTTISINDSFKLIGAYGRVFATKGWGLPHYRKIDNSSAGRIQKLVLTPDTVVWVAAKRGLYSFRISDSVFKPVRIPDIAQGPVRDMIYHAPTERLWVAGNAGVYYLQNAGWHRLRVGNNNFEPAHALVLDSQGLLWIGTNNGLFCLDTSLRITYAFYQHSGINSSNVQSLHYNERSNTLWVGTDNGVSSIDLSLLKSRELYIPKIRINRIAHGGIPCPVSDDLVLPYDKRDVTFSFTCLYYSDPQSVRYTYWLDDSASANETALSSVSFSDLPYGPHDLYVYASGNNTGRSDLLTFHFTIATPFWATTVFRLLAAMAIILFVYAIYLKRLSVIKKRLLAQNAIAAQITSLKQQALSASLNPHFIFNSLNAIQYFVNTHDLLTANEYFSKFARLIRTHLDEAEKTHIPLDKEIERLKAYLSLEQLRFDNELEFHIEIDKEIIQQRTYIPNMVLQPFVENAIWHGLLPDKVKGRIEISAFRRRECLVLTIKDNGIGIRAAEKYRKPGHISHGIRIITERLKILSEDKAANPVAVTDLGESVPPEKGTMVVITLSDCLYFIQPA